MSIVDSLSKKKHISLEDIHSTLRVIRWNAFNVGLANPDEEMLLVKQARIELMTNYVGRGNDLAAFINSKLGESEYMDALALNISTKMFGIE